MNKVILSLSLMFFLFGCSSPDEDKPEKEKPTMVLKCKYNPSALYVDTFNFFEDNSVVRTSTNSSSKKETYKLIVKENAWVLSGTKTIIKNGVTSTYPDTELFAIATNNKNNWNYGIYYLEDFETDPFKFMVCNRTIWMEEKYLKFYTKFIRHPKTLSDGGVILNSDLEYENYAN